MMRKRVPQKKTLQKFFSYFTFNQYSLLLHGRSDALFPKEIQLKAKIGRNTLFNSVIPWGLKKGFIKREGRKIFWVPFKYFSPLKKPKKIGIHVYNYELICQQIDEYGQKLLNLIETGKLDEWLKRNDLEPFFRRKVEWLANIAKKAKTREELLDLLKFDWFKDLIKARIILEREYLKKDAQKFIEKMLSDRQRLKIREQMLKGRETFAAVYKHGMAPPVEHILGPAPIDKAELEWKERQGKEVLKKLRKTGKTTFT